MKTQKIILFCYFLCLQTYVSIAQKDRSKILEATDTTSLLELSKSSSRTFLEKNSIARNTANSRGIPITIETDNSFSELMYFTDTGRPIYYTTNNVDAAISTNTNTLQTGGSSGLNLDGSGMDIGEWDGGGLLLTHEQISGRAVQVDGALGTSSHAMHVAGTLIGDGIGIHPDAHLSKGMAPQATLSAHYWDNDISEMATFAANGGLVSNHSYAILAGWSYTDNGVFWFGGINNLVANGEDPSFGKYDYLSSMFDQIANDAPHYLICKAAGNDQGELYLQNGDIFTDSETSQTFTYNFNIHPGPDGSFDCISTYGNAKNILTVGAVSDVPNYTNPSDVEIAPFSSRGPTDDGRIKPDIVGNGVDLFSCYDNHNSDYSTKSGTSMATPNVAGSLVLLQEYYEKLNGTGNFMKSATLKGLAIHTAKEAGITPGPDYTFGWGLLDSRAAVQQIAYDVKESNSIIETTINNGSTFNINLDVNTNKPFIVTLVWNDPAAPFTPYGILDDPTLKLVNDLDLRATDGINNYYPYKLNPNNPNLGATTGDNFRDNVEKIFVSSVNNGNVTITVSHKGALDGGMQDFSLIISEVASCFESPLTLFLNFDEYPDETSWDIQSATGAILYQDGPYDLSFQSLNTFFPNFNFTMGDNYIFTIKDSANDGICCGYGNGIFILKDNNGRIIAAGNNFGALSSQTFCIGNSTTCVPNLNLTDISINGLYQASNTLTSSGITSYGSNITYRAGNFIQLNPGFQTQTNSTFHAYIAPCNLSPITPISNQETKNKIPESEVISFETQLQVSPNPVKQEANISFYLPTITNVRINIFDLNGQLLTELSSESVIGWNSTQLDTSQLPSGIYYVALQTIDGKWTKKIVKQ